MADEHRVHEVVERILDIFEADFETNLTALGGGSYPADQTKFKTLLPCPVDSRPGMPCLSVWFSDDSDEMTEDSPQETGESMGEMYTMEAHLEMPLWTRETAKLVHDYRDAMRRTIRTNRTLAHPTSGEVLAWVPWAEVVSSSVNWLHYKNGQGGVITITVRVRVVVDIVDAY